MKPATDAIKKETLSVKQWIIKGQKIIWKHLTNSWVILSMILLGLIFPLFFIGEIKPSFDYDFEKLNNVGGFLAGTSGIIWALASVLLFYKSIIIGQKQQSESSYLGLISHLREHVNSTKGKVNDKDLEGEVFFSAVFVKFRVSAKRADNCQYYNPASGDFKGGFDRFEDFPNKILKLDYILCVYNDMFEEYHNQLGHFYRLVFNIIKIIDKNETLDINDKKTYINMVQVVLSNDILGLVFYNALTNQAKTGSGKDKFRLYLDNYQLLENIDPTNIIQYKDLEQYPKTTFKHISEEESKKLVIL